VESLRRSGSASTFDQFWSFWIRDVWGNILSGRIGLALFGQVYLTQGSSPLGVILSLFFNNETRLKSAFFEALTGLLAFMVGKV